MMTDRQIQVRKKIGIVQEEWTDEQCSAMEEGLETGDSKVCSTLYSITKTSQQGTAV